SSNAVVRKGSGLTRLENIHEDLLELLHATKFSCEIMIRDKIPENMERRIVAFIDLRRHPVPNKEVYLVKEKELDSLAKLIYCDEKFIFHGMEITFDPDTDMDQHTQKAVIDAFECIREAFGSVVNNAQPKITGLLLQDRLSMHASYFPQLVDLVDAYRHRGLEHNCREAVEFLHKAQETLMNAKRINTLKGDELQGYENRMKMLGAEWAHASASLSKMDKNTSVDAAKFFSESILLLTEGGEEVKEGKAAAEYRLCLVYIQAKQFGMAGKAAERACAMMPDVADYREAKEQAVKKDAQFQKRVREAAEKNMVRLIA
ncbi:MAG: hypothetical protein Q9174_004104, partial [Haloplaca sp. 1 TL-2023]